jgi:excisionase family DNA binding protein
MEIEHRWLSVRDAAIYLGVEADTVYRWIRERGLPAHRIGKLLKMKVVEIDAWVLANDAGGLGKDAHRGK